MKNINNISKLIEVSKSWKPSDLAFITRLEWSFNNLVIEFLGQERNPNLQWPDFLNKFYAVEVRFDGIRNLKLEIEGDIRHQISGFDITNISGNGLENVNFHINDYENDSIDFYCDNVTIINVLEPYLPNWENDK